MAHLFSNLILALEKKRRSFATRSELVHLRARGVRAEVVAHFRAHCARARVEHRLFVSERRQKNRSRSAWN